MSIVKFVNAKNRCLSQLNSAIKYITNEKKAPAGFISQTGLSADFAFADMLTLKVLFGKTSGRQYIHFIVSFDENVSATDAFHIGCEILSYFRGKYQVLMSTHTNTDNNHLHYIINSVGFNGYKFRQSKRKLQTLKDWINEILEQNGLNPVGKIGRLREDDWLDNWEEAWECLCSSKFDEKFLYVPIWFEDDERLNGKKLITFYDNEQHRGKPLITFGEGRAMITFADDEQHAEKRLIWFDEEGEDFDGNDDVGR